MSDFHHHLLLRKRFRRDRKKTISASMQSTMIKRPLDEWNPSTDLFPVKRRAISATTSTTTGCENDHSTLIAIKDELNVTTTPSPPRRTVTRFETSLPNEILYEIFKYLSQSDLFYAFFNLNQRLNDVLLPFTSHIDCSKLSLRQFEHIRNHLIYGQALTINNQYAIKQVFRIDLNRSRFPRLERLALIDPTIDELNLVFAKLKQLTVRTLNIRIQRPSSSNHETTYKSCLQHHLFGPTSLPTLTSISIEMHHNDYLQFLTPNDISLQYEHLLELTIPLRSFDSLLLLLEHLPNLRKFTVKLFADPTPVNVPLTGKPPNNLLDFELHVTGHELNFDRFVLLMTSRLRASKLERLAYFNRTTTDQTYFNGHRWEIFLENSFPRLKKLEFCFDMPIDENVTPVGPILQSFASFDHPWSIGHLIWRPHSNKTRLKLFTLPYAFDTLKLSTSNSRLPAEHLQQFQAVRKLVLDATHGTMKDIYQQLIELLNQHCRKATSLQIQNIVLANTESIAVKRACRHIKHLIINECDGRLVPLLFAIATDIRTLTVTGPLLLKYFLKSPPTDATFLRRIRTLELNCMQIDRQNRLNRLLSDLPRLFPSLEHLTMDINPKLFVELKSIERMLDVLAHLISLKVQRTNKYLLDKTVQDDRRTRTFFEVHSNRLRRCDTYEIVCKESQLEFWL